MQSLVSLNNKYLPIFVLLWLVWILDRNFGGNLWETMIQFQPVFRKCAY